ncbi:hypothetical protein DUNSADRAFT_17265, partial [Dunaliella salina]
MLRGLLPGMSALIAREDPSSPTKHAPQPMHNRRQHQQHEQQQRAMSKQEDLLPLLLLLEDDAGLAAELREHARVQEEAAHQQPWRLVQLPDLSSQGVLALALFYHAAAACASHPAAAATQEPPPSATGVHLHAPPTPPTVAAAAPSLTAPQAAGPGAPFPTAQQPAGAGATVDPLAARGLSEPESASESAPLGLPGAAGPPACGLPDHSTAPSHALGTPGKKSETPPSSRCGDGLAASEAGVCVAQLLMSLGCPLLSARMRRRVHAGPAVGGIARSDAARAEQEGCSAGDGFSGEAKAGAGVREAEDSSRISSSCSSSSSSSSSSRSGTGVEALVWGVLPVLQAWVLRACRGHSDAYRQCSEMVAPLLARFGVHVVESLSCDFVQDDPHEHKSRAAREASKATSHMQHRSTGMAPTGLQPMQRQQQQQQEQQQQSCGRDTREGSVPQHNLPAHVLYCRRDGVLYVHKDAACSAHYHRMAVELSRC